MTQDDRMETITDPAEIRAKDEPDEITTARYRALMATPLDGPMMRGETTPAPASGAGLDLDALHETICDNFTGMAEVRQAADLLVAEVRRLTRLGQCDLDLLMRAEAADAEVVTLRAKLTAVEAVERGLSEGWVMLATVSDRAEFVRDLRAALAITTGGDE